MARKFTDFVTEAKRKNTALGIKEKEPFEIEFPDGKTISISYPNATTWLAMQASPNDLETLKMLFGSNIAGYNKLIEYLNNQPIEVLSVLFNDMWEFWGDDLAQTPGK